MSHVILRKVNHADLPALVTVLQTAFEEYRGWLDPPSGAHTESVEKLRQKLTEACAIVAIIDHTIVGCVFYEIRTDEKEQKFMYLGRLAVLPSYRRRGLGQALVQYVESRAKELRLSRVRLGVRVVLKENRAYYERQGYSVLALRSHPGYTEPTYVIMEKELSA